MLIHVLGSAAGGGFPQWNCNCANCAGLRAGRLRAKARTQSSVAVSADGVAWVLINASPDIRAQIAAFPALQPARAIRDTGIAAVIVVDSQIDHCTGLLMLREHRPIQLYSTSVVLEDLSTGLPLVNVLKHYCGVEHHPLIADGRTAFTVAGVPGLRFTALPIHSKAPPYSPHRHDPHPGDNIALLIEDAASGRRAFYAPGLGAVDGAVREAMTAADCLLVDGTFWRDDEMAVAGISSKRARDMGHLPQSGADGMIAALGAFAGKRRILIHINNTNPILDEDSPERAELERAGIEVAVDGLDLAI